MRRKNKIKYQSIITKCNEMKFTDNRSHNRGSWSGFIKTVLKTESSDFYIFILFFLFILLFFVLLSLWQQLVNLT